MAAAGHQLGLAHQVADHDEEHHAQRRAARRHQGDREQAGPQDFCARPPDDKAGQAGGQGREPERRALEEEVADQAGGEADDGARVGTGDEAGANGQQHQQVGGDVINPQVVAEGGLQEDPHRQEQGDLEHRPGQGALIVPPRSSCPAHPDR